MYPNLKSACIAVVNLICPLSLWNETVHVRERGNVSKTLGYNKGRRFYLLHIYHLSSGHSKYGSIWINIFLFREQAETRACARFQGCQTNHQILFNGIQFSSFNTTSLCTEGIRKLDLSGFGWSIKERLWNGIQKPKTGHFKWFSNGCWLNYWHTVTTWIPNTWIPDTMGVRYSNGKVMWLLF